MFPALYFILAVPGIIVLILGIYFRFVSAGGQPGGFGYKTPVTIKNSETWQDSNAFAGNMFMLLGLINIVLWPFSGWVFREGGTMIVMCCLGWTVFTINILVSTIEGHIKNKFDRNGERKNTPAFHNPL